MDKVKKTILSWILDRLSERSTAAGISAVCAGVGMAIAPDIAALASGAVGLVLVFARSRWLF